MVVFVEVTPHFSPQTVRNLFIENRLIPLDPVAPRQKNGELSELRKSS